MTPQPTLVLNRVLQVMQPLVRLLVRNGVTYKVLATALKRVFLQAAHDELTARGMPATDSAVTLLCGVHRRDVRLLSRSSPEPVNSGAPQASAAPTPASPTTPQLGLAAQVVARWMHAPDFVDSQGRPRALNKTGQQASFDSLVAGISSDVRPRAVRDELLRLGVVREQGDTLVLEGHGFAPRQGFVEMSDLFAANLHDHAAAAAANLQGDNNFLEQAVFVDQITPASAQLLQAAAVKAWQQAFKTVMAEAQHRFDADASQQPIAQRTHRARFGVYFYSAPEDLS